jgi:hypothetical protein
MSALMLSALDSLEAVMFKWKSQKSVIKPKLDCRGQGTGVRWWRIQLVEETDEPYTKHPGLTFDHCVKLVEEKLKDWPDCKRMAHDMWDFKHRKDAEKFITLFHLSWAQ